MSHMTKLLLKVTDKRLMEGTAKRLGIEVHRDQQFRNKYAGWTEEDCVILGSKDRPALIITKDGDVKHDWYWMDRTNGQKFCQEYAEAVIRKQASRSGGTVSSVTTDNMGNRVLVMNF